MRRAAGFRDRLDHRLRPRLVPAVDHDRDALPGQCRRDAGTDARRAAGDERSLALKLQVHLNLLREGPSGQQMSTIVDFGLRKVYGCRHEGDAKIRAVGWTASARFRGYAASHSGIGFVCLRAGRL